MDSIVKQRNDGFDQNGNFLNGQTDLLPWPKTTLHNSIYAVQSSNPQLAFEGALPSPFGDGCMYTRSVGINQIISKYDRDGELLWTFNAKTIMSNVHDIKLLHFYDDGVNKWLIGAFQNSDNYIRHFRLNTDNLTYVISPTYAPDKGIPNTIATLEDGSLHTSISYGTARYAYLLDFETMEATKTSNKSITLVGLNYVTPLFNGCVAFVSSNLETSSGTGTSGAYGYASSITVNFAVNLDLTFTEPKGKQLIRTEHIHALEAMYVKPTQLSKDVFYCPPRENESVTGFANHSYQARFYTRKELETWVSNCIYASTGFRIPLSNEV